ncbi:hypothetical protein WME90_29375 [Sorangium sp. So ce375]
MDKAFPGHQHHVVLSDLRSMAMMLQRFGDTQLGMTAKRQAQARNAGKS